jgi:hypothetical protein
MPGDRAAALGAQIMSAGLPTATASSICDVARHRLVDGVA